MPTVPQKHIRSFTRLPPDPLCRPRNPPARSPPNNHPRQPPRRPGARGTAQPGSPPEALMGSPAHDMGFSTSRPARQSRSGGAQTHLSQLMQPPLHMACRHLGPCPSHARIPSPRERNLLHFPPPTISARAQLSAPPDPPVTFMDTLSQNSTPSPPATPNRTDMPPTLINQQGP
jgi:hypothetical protein